MTLPFPDSSIDVIYAQGVLHHTDSTESALRAATQKLRSGGRFLFYVYRKKGPSANSRMITCVQSCKPLRLMRCGRR